MAEKKGDVLARWSRLKRAARQAPKANEAAAGAPLPELPPVDQLGFESDFSGFMDRRVDDALRRSALKALFRASHFNVHDGLDVYAEDYTKLETLTKEMVAELEHAKRILRGPESEAPAQADADGVSTSSQERPSVEIEPPPQAGPRADAEPPPERKDDGAAG
jgi:Protein of unknown function (DUF3306)